ncbi:MAG: phenylacetate--CoA ligase family protein, partial [Candidatus Binatia bacterium]|nr:phenylacetate--CoA ligase family protein [Candidatus Binatia bacterium]
MMERGNVCPCGRTLDLFMGGILGRYDDMVKVRGVQLTPQMIEEIVRGFPVVEEFFTTVENRSGLDTLMIKLEIKQDSSSAPTGQIVDQIKQRVKNNLGLSPEVSIEPYNSLPRFELKARRFQDLRAKANR